MSENCLRLDFPQSSMLLNTMAYTYGHVTMLLPSAYNVIFPVTLMGSKSQQRHAFPFFSMPQLNPSFKMLSDKENQIIFYLSRSRLLQSLHKAYS